MDSPPPSTPPYTRSSAEPRLRSKPASRLAPALDGGEGHNDTQIVPFLATPPSRKKSPLSASPLHLSSHSPVPLKDLLLLSPSPRHKPKGRLAVEESLEVAAAGGTPRRKGKSRAAAVAAMGLMGCASPRNARRARRRLEKEIVREEREIGPGEDDGGGRVRRRRQSRSKVANKERLSLLPSVPSSPSPAAEADVVRAAQVILPVANAALAKTQEIFCGDPLRTLQACFRLVLSSPTLMSSSNTTDLFYFLYQVAPVLLFGAMYGHLITLRRLLATGTAKTVESLRIV
ncbi:hypothetical protein B296_00042771 [Ensete ventricosum]|uniref:Uncharacterized protein n=1 Tax=Ensete ventricosum TaxID=4639 RepID=A0A426Y650_ENSVE|nr:hypothetical protein B296_00042771 [Ensete ventricosum]